MKTECCGNWRPVDKTSSCPQDLDNPRRVAHSFNSTNDGFLIFQKDKRTRTTIFKIIASM